MIITIASGKGGTGKTTVATNLALSLSKEGQKVQYLDCDVEEPNGHIFLKPEFSISNDVTVAVPDVNLKKCTGCGKCAELCQYNAITCIKEKTLVFEQLCHSCGGCMAICPENAIAEKNRKIGIVESGNSNGILFGHGKLEIGAIQTPALIKNVKSMIKSNTVNIIDAPPGTSCPVIETIKGSDFVLLVTEPSPFGLNDLKLAVDMVREMKLPFAVAINRCDIGDDSVIEYCRKEYIKVILEIPNERRIAESYSRGNMMVDSIPEYKQLFLDLYSNTKRICNNVQYEQDFVQFLTQN